MEQNENYLDMIINSLKYSVSDLNALFWGGIATLASMILIGIPFLFGYITRSGREVLHGNNKLPAWGNLGEAFKDGVMIILVMLFFGLISGILYVFIVPFFIIGAITGNDAMMAAGLFMLLPAIVITLATCLLMPAAWITYAVTGDLFKALNPINALKARGKEPDRLHRRGRRDAYRADRAVHPRCADHNRPLDIVCRVHVKRVHLRVVLQADDHGHPRPQDHRPRAGHRINGRPSFFPQVA